MMKLSHNLVNFVQGKNAIMQKILYIQYPVNERFQRLAKNKKNLTNYYLAFFLMSLCIGMLFYNSAIFGLVLFLLAPLFYSKYIYSLVQKEENQIKLDFKDALYTISASVAAGRQIPRAVADAAKQGILLNPKSIIAPKLKEISDAYEMSNSSLIEEFGRLADEMNLDEIILFSDSFSICQLNGGDLESLCLKSSIMIIKSLDFDMEVETILSEKRLDMILLLLMPIALLFLLNLSCSDYLMILYTTSEGRVVMSVSLLLMIMASLWSLKIMKLNL